jgi:hypothetical protein
MRYDHFSMLPENAFKPRNGRNSMTLEGGSSSGPQSVTQTSIPEYAQPAMESLIGKAQALTGADYQRYEGDRFAAATPQQGQARYEAAQLQTPGQFGVGTGMTGAGGMQALRAGSDYMRMATSPQSQQAFMSPYMQNVVNVQKSAAIRDAQKAQLGANLSAARSGTYGGARQTLAQAERERGLNQTLAEIQAKGSQAAFEDARKAQQFGSEIGLRGAGQGIEAGRGLAQIGQAQQAAEIERLRNQEMFGSLTQAEKQRLYDLQYQDFMAQQQFPYTQISYMGDILRGIPGRSVYEYQQPAGGLQSIIGPGLLGLGMYKEFLK